MRRRRWLLWLLLVVLAAAAAGVVVVRRRKPGVEVTLHTVGRSDVVSRVSATGRIEAKRKVELSANVMGPIVNLAVREGDRVRKGDLLLQIDRAQLAAQTSGSEANLAALQAEKTAAESALAQAEDQFARVESNYRAAIIAEAEFTRAGALRDQAAAGLAAVVRRIEQARATVLMARDSLAKTTIVSPIDGLVTALPVEEGEIAVIGTMNNPGTRLMTISDMSEVQADLEVDETDVPRVKLGQAATVTVDALPEQRLRGEVSEIASSPIVRPAGGSQAVEFSVKVLLAEPPEALRPGFSVAAEIETGEAKGVVAIPVQALVIQDLAEKVAAQEAAAGEGRQAATPTPGKGERDVEGVFRLVDGKARFTPVTTGLQGELVIEVREGLKEGERIVTGPFRTLRTLRDGDLVREEEKKPGSGERRGGE